MNTRAFPKTILALFMLASVPACQSREKAFSEAIHWYYFETNKNPGAGQTHLSAVNILESIRISDTTFVLARIEGSHTPPPLPEEKQSTATEHKLWFLMVKENKRYEVVGIRDPEVYSP